MTLREYLRVLKDKSLVIGLVVGLVAAGTIGLLRPPSYQAQSMVYVSAQGFMADAARAYSGNELSIQKIKSYVQLITSDRIREDVSRRLHTNVRPGQIGADSKPETALINVTASDHSAEQAQRIANAASVEFVSMLAELEKPTDDPGSPAPVIARVVQAAPYPARPASPGLAVYLVLGAMVGTLIGYLVALLRQVMDTRIRSAEQLRRLARVPVLAQVVATTGDAVGLLGRETAPQVERVESLRALRTNLRFHHGDQQPRTLVVVGAVPGEAATTTACDLALVMAETGMQVALVEADLRSPRALEYLGLSEPAEGLSDVLAGRVTLDQTLRPLPGRHLHMLPGGSVPENASALLNSPAMGQLLTDLGNRYDAVVIDAPPLLSSADTLALAARSDGLVLVVCQGTTSEEDLASSITALETVRAELLGTVLTVMPRKSRETPQPSSSAPPAPLAPPLVDPIRNGQASTDAGLSSHPKAGDTRGHPQT